MRRPYTGKQRLELIGLVRSGRATVSEAAERQGVALSTAYYWVKRARRMGGGDARREQQSKTPAHASPTFVRVLPSREAPAEIVLRVGSAEVQVRRGFDAELLHAVVEALRGNGG